MTMDKKEFFGFVKFALLVAAVLVIAMAFPSCTTVGGPATVINSASGQVVDVPAGNRVMVISPYGGGYARSSGRGSTGDWMRAGVDHHAISARERTDMAEIESEREENQLRFKSDVARELSRMRQNSQREWTYRARDLQRFGGDVAPYAAKAFKKWQRRR